MVNLKIKDFISEIEMDRSRYDHIWSKVKGIFAKRNDSDKIDELQQAVLDASEDAGLEPEECSMIQGVLELDKTQVQEIMTPRTDTEFVESESSIMDTAKLFKENGFSRMPVFKDTRDNVIGVVHVKDLLPPLLDPQKIGDAVDTVMRPPIFVPETKPVDELLHEFRTAKNHFAIVVDEYGGTSGIVTIEDALEQIVGNIEDEHDTPEDEGAKIMGNGTIELSGRVLLEELDQFDIHITSDDVDTIGGYLCLEAGRVPVRGEEFTCNGWVFTVQDADAKHIRTVIASREDTLSHKGEIGGNDAWENEQNH